MMEQHYCAHSAIPGYAAPNSAAIRIWAVKQAYEFCVKNELPEVWAYLWENWYRKGRWDLWAANTCPEDNDDTREPVSDTSHNCRYELTNAYSW